jgi:hypothetical protein
VRAIETTYRGYKFRSRLEARYAVLFDTLGFDWSYEAEGFELESGRYLPDFHIADVPFWLEVKGEIPTVRELMLARELCETTHEDVWLCDGDLMHFESDDIRLRHRCFSWINADTEILKQFLDSPMTMGGTERAERIYILGGEASLLTDVLPGHVAHLWKRGILQVVMAADKMRSTRFEHNQEPSRTSWKR